jgi:hypothetical protein
LNDFLKSNAKDIGMIFFLAIGAYFTIQSNTEDIISLQKKDVELEANKVGNSTMVLKEQFLDAELSKIEEEISDLNIRLDKKIKIIKAQNDIIFDLSVRLAVVETKTDQNEGELTGIWKFINKFLEEL